MSKVFIKCYICEKKCKNLFYYVPEMMWGIGDEFKYVKCTNCGSLMLYDVPESMDKYYPTDYYSYQTYKSSQTKIIFKILRAKATLGHKVLFGKLLTKLFGQTPFAYWIKDLGMEFSDPILDVGCGSGLILKDMSDAGFKNLLGIDPYLKKNKIEGDHFTIRQMTIDQIDGKFKLIMFNHSLEHIENPLITIKKANRLLTHDGILLIRIPIIDSYAWEKYQINWIQLDAPRHRFIPSKTGLKILASRAGMTVTKIHYDSNEFQFWGSEQSLRGIPLKNEKSYLINPKKSIISKKEIRKYKRRAKILNQSKKGDQACFYLTKRKQRLK